MDDKWHIILKQIEKLKPVYDSVEKKINGNIALFGAGQFGEAAFKYLTKNNYNVICFIDNSAHKHGTSLCGLPIVAYNDELVSASDVILITAKHAISTISSLIDKKNPNISFDAWFAVSKLDKYKFLRESIFNDKRSKECLDGILMTMLTGNEEFCASVMDFNQYFCLPQFVNNGNEYFVDAGAYVGDTVEKFIWANNGGFNKIYAFEPCDQQYNALLKRKQRLIEEWALNSEKISLIKAGLGEKDSFCKINIMQGHLLGANLTVCDSDENISGIEVKRLDDIIADDFVSFIKADIEGMELEMLMGAAKVIKNNKPKMALSVYHKPDDLIEIVDYILSINKEYNISLRHHSPMLMDTTIYCW